MKNHLDPQHQYHTDLLSCYRDWELCFYGLFCPCCLNASNLAALREENCTIIHCTMNMCPFWVRQLTKDKFGIPKSYVDDCLTTTLCSCCAICQDAREIMLNEDIYFQKPLLPQSTQSYTL